MAIEDIQYCTITIDVQGDIPYKVDCLYDTCCTLLLAKEEVFPEKIWEAGPVKRLIYANNQISETSKVAKQISFTLGQKIYTEDFWQNTLMSQTIILGNSFWIKHTPLVVNPKEIILDNNNRITLFNEKKNMLTSHQSHTYERSVGIQIPKTLSTDKLDQIKFLLKPCFSDNPLALKGMIHSSVKLP